jgi:hypothetical protein
MKIKISELLSRSLRIGIVGTLSLSGVGCGLFKGEKYSSQWEVETEVPTSLDKGKPSAGVVASSANSRAASVPADSNLIELPEGTKMEPGSAASQTIVDIPPPNVPSAREGRTEILSRPSSSSMDPNQTVLSDLPSAGSGITDEPVGTMDEPGIVTATDLEGVPSALPRRETASTIGSSDMPASGTTASTPPAEPVVPLLHGSKRLSDFYSDLHRDLLPLTTVEATPSDTSLPPPPVSEGSSDPTAPELSAPSIYPEETPIPSGQNPNEN